MRKLIVLLFPLLPVFSGCNLPGDEMLENKPNLLVRLTASPAEYEEVLIDIQAIEVNYTTAGEEDKSLYDTQINYGVYNLLDYTDGKDTLLAEITMPAGYITQMRIVLGEHNNVKVDGVYYELKTPSSQQSGLKLNVDSAISENVVFNLLINVDVASSIVQLGNDNFIFKPVISTFNETSADITKNMIEPSASKPY